MDVEQMSAADLLREGKQAMALAMGSVGPDTRVRWAAVMAEIDLRLSVGDLDEDDLEGAVGSQGRNGDSRDRRGREAGRHGRALQGYCGAGQRPPADP